MSMTVLKARGVSKMWDLSPGFAGPGLGRLLGKEPRRVHALADVDLDLRRGECLGLVGESGCGKTTLGRCLVRQLVPDAGSVTYIPSSGEEIRLDRLRGDELRRVRRRLQLVFQESSQSLDPRLRVGESLALALEPGEREDADRRREKVEEILESVGLEAGHADRLPHQLSGGQRQRVGIARALAAEPEVIVLDEPVSALDARHRERILDLLAGLRRRHDLSFVFIGHDLSVVRRVADRVAVLYLGRIVELGPVEEIFRSPRHPYTAALLEAAPRLVLYENVPVPRAGLRGEVPSAVDPPPGCAFHPRCPRAEERCRIERPELEPGGPDRRAACHFPIESR